MPRIEKEITVMNRQGLHARPAALFVQIASKYDAKVTVKKNEESVNGKSIMGVLMLGAEYQTKITVIADGDDAEAVIKDLEEFLSKHE
jgi:phosphocarrier protein